MKAIRISKIAALILAAAIICAAFVSCGTTPATGTSQGTNVPSTAAPGTTAAPTGTATAPGTASSGVTSTIALNGNEVLCGEGAVFENKIVKITKPGTYTLSGKLDDGQIRVTVTKEEKVELVLNGVDIKYSAGAVIYVESADKVSINVAEGTENVLTDSTGYVFEEGEDKPNACVFAEDDLTVKGGGKLTINANYKNGLSGENDIKIKEVTLVINAFNTGVRGKDSIEIESGNITIVAGNDGLKSTNDKETGRGYVQITGGTISITAGDDALQAVTEIVASDCKITATAKGKLYNCPGTVSIAEGVVNG